jgi:transcriptional regulator with XRE-family HTH domain
LARNHIVMIKSIGTTIKSRRKALRIRQPDLAELAEISVNTLYRIERGVANPTLIVLDKIAGILGMELRMEVKSSQS